MDNDIYGHVNNVQYYSYFDTAVNLYLIEEAGLNIHEDKTVGYVVNSGCSYFSPTSYPDSLEIGLHVGQIGNSSVRYELAVFRSGEDAASAHGHMVHVFVDRVTNKVVPIPQGIREKLKLIST